MATNFDPVKDIGSSAVSKSLATLNNTQQLTAAAEKIQSQIPPLMGTSIFQGTGSTNNTGSVNNTGDASGKVSQAAKMAYAWLDTKTSGDGAKVNKTINSKRPSIIPANLPDGVQAQTDGNSIKISTAYAAKSSVGQIAASILHEANHIALGGGDQADEKRAESFAEEFRDDNGIGIYNGDGDVQKWVDKNYSELPKDGVNYYA